MILLKQSQRLYLESGQMDAAIGFYEALQATRCEKKLAFPAMGIDVAVIGNFILLAGDAAALAPVRAVQATLTVDSLDEAKAWLEKNGAVILAGPSSAPHGRHLVARHPDGLVAEYFQAAGAVG